MIDILIQNGTIIDGSGAPARKADLAISGERITTIENLPNAQARQVIDARGLVVAPGFIDAHSHGDYVLPFLPTADSKIAQGITLEVVGNCGGSMAPLSPAMREELNKDKLIETAGDKVDWETFEGYLDRLRRQGVSVNVAPLVGHGTVREKVMGMTDAAPTSQQLAEMKDEVARAMDAGAIGFTTGLIYTPNVYAETAEIVALAQAAAEKDGIYTSHIRGEGDTLLEAAEEALTVGRRAEIAVEISHLKASGPRNWPKMPQVIDLIETARREGLDVTADMYPYPASNTGMTSLIPAWAHVGGTEAFIQRLKDPATRQRLHAEVRDERWESILIAYCPAHQEYNGRYMHEIAAERKQHPLDAVMDILVDANLSTDIIMFGMKEENVALGLKQPWVMIGTDGGGRAFEGPYAAGKPHPRNFATFPRVLGKYCREEKLFPLEEAVRKMTALPAEKFRLRQRGLLKPGYFADVVLFDPLTVIDTSTFVDPHQRPTGIPWVLVNGQPVIADGKHTGARPGQMVK